MRCPNERGETLVEVVMALGILSLVLVSSYALATGTFRLGRGAGERTQAVNYLQEQVEALRTYRNSNTWETFRNRMNAYGTNSFCMQQQAGVWAPTTEKCKRDAIDISIKATPTVTANVDGEQFNYELTATWKTGNQDNNVRLTTKLVKVSDE